MFFRRLEWEMGERMTLSRAISEGHPHPHAKGFMVGTQAVPVPLQQSGSLQGNHVVIPRRYWHRAQVC